MSTVFSPFGQVEMDSALRWEHTMKSHYGVLPNWEPILLGLNADF